MGTRRALSAALLVLAVGAPALAQEAAHADSAPRDAYAVLGTWGQLSRAGDHAGLAGLEIVEVRPERWGARVSVTRWIQTGGTGLWDTEAGIAGVIPVVPRLRFVATAGPAVIMGNGFAFGLFGNVGALAEPVGRLLLRATVGGQWLYDEGGFVQFGTWTVGAGWRLGPYARPGGRDSTRAVH